MDENVNVKSAMSIRRELKRDLLAGVRVTPLYGMQQYGTMDLRKRLSELRNEDGLNIECEWQTSTSGKRYKVHYMTNESIINYLKLNKN